jgi:hypothetical protein
LPRPPSGRLANQTPEVQSTNFEQIFTCSSLGSERRRSELVDRGLHLAQVSFPAGIKDSYPLEGQSPNGGVVRFTSVDHIPVESLGPRREESGRAGKLTECLPQEFRTGPSPMALAILAAAHDYWRDPAESGDVQRVLPARAVGAKCTQQSGSQYRTRSRETAKDFRIGMGGEELADALVVVNDDRVEGENLPSQALGFKPAGDENGLVEGEWLGLRQNLQTLLKDVRTAKVMCITLSIRRGSRPSARSESLI